MNVALVRIEKRSVKGRFDTSSSFMPADVATLKSLRALYDTDDQLIGKKPGFLTYQDGTWWWRDKIYVPKSMRNLILKQYHETPLAGHWGSMKTLDMLTRTFGWPEMRADVLDFIKKCLSCQSVKVDHRPPQGLLKPLPIPDRPWSTIGVDFVVKLPISDGQDSVMVVVDHFSKAAHFIPAQETWSAEQMATSFIREVFKLHGLPDKIVSDRGSIFMSKFWSSVLQQLQVSQAPSTAFHPQTDGQVERTNALLEDHLRHFCNDEQNDWARWLPMAEFAYNNTASSSTKLSPFFAQLGFHPRFNSLVASSGIPAADSFVQHLHQIQTSLRDSLTAAKEAQSHFYNKNRRVNATYAPGDLVWLSRRNIKTKRANSKLDVRRLGPFPVIRMVGQNAAELALPKAYSRLHPVFNVSLLSPFFADPQVQHQRSITPTLTFEEAFTDWASTRFILDYKNLGPELHSYLLRDEDPSGLNDEWRLLSLISPNLDPFLQQFHRQSPHLGSGPSKEVWVRRAGLQV